MRQPVHRGRKARQLRLYNHLHQKHCQDCQQQMFGWQRETVLEHLLSQKKTVGKEEDS